MKKRQYIIDKKFQFKKIFLVIGFVSVIIIFLIISVGVVIGLNNRKISVNNSGMTENITSIRKAIDIQQNIILNFSLIPVETGNKRYVGMTQKLANNYNSSIDSLNTAITSNEKMMNSNIDIIKKSSFLIAGIFAISVLGMLILFVLLVKHTHRISGPIFKMSGYINDILNKKFPDMRDLRSKDDFKDFYKLFRDMAERLIELEKQEMKKNKKSKK